MQAEALRTWRERPQKMVRDLFNADPDPWQDEALSVFPTCPRMAMRASKGPGKTTVLAWCAWNFLLTRKEPNIAACSISGDNLRDGLWKEMAKWHGRSTLLQDQFTITGERIFLKENRENWFMTARSWSKTADPETLGNTLAGLHADNILFLLDEAGSMPVAIVATAEAALSSATEGHIVMAGNTNSLEGALYHACVKQKSLWRTVIISGDPDDPKRSTRVSIEWAKEMIKSWGRENPFVKVMVLGEWPESSLNALISATDVETAMARRYQLTDVEGAPRILGVDVAREGDDMSVIFPRQGLVGFPPKKMRNVNSIQGAGQVSRTWADWNVDACFIDNTGGFGAGWIDQLSLLNRAAIGVGFKQRAQDVRYANRRAEMYFRAAEWIKAGGALPDEPDIIAELTETNYTFKGDALLLEPKEVIKVKLGRSPDLADAFVLTFADHVAPRAVTSPLPKRVSDNNDYDPFRRFFAGAR
jgi:phage terminase large subunit